MYYNLITKKYINSNRSFMHFTKITNKHNSNFPEPKAKKSKKPGPINDIPGEMIMEIFSYLGLIDFIRASSTCITWNKVVAKNSLLNRCVYNDIAFGKDKWIKYFGKGVVENDQEDFKALPKGIAKILLTRLPHSKERVMDNHMLVWIPKQIKGKDLTLVTMGELMKDKCFPKTKMGYRTIGLEILKKQGNKSLKESHWVLMTKQVLPGTIGLWKDKQMDLMRRYAEKTKIAYEVPKILEAVVCIFAEYVRTDNKTRLFSDKHSRLIRCKEKIDDIHVVVGAFDKSGLCLFSDAAGLVNSGLAVLRNFSFR